MLLVMTISTVLMLVFTMRLIELRFVELARALAPSVACSALLAVALLLLLPPSRSLSPLASLAVLAGAGTVVYLAASAVLARSVWVPMWASLRPRA